MKIKKYLKFYFSNIKISNKKMEEICIICYENLNKENILKLNCSHKFHYKCFEKLMFINDKKNKNIINCPCCHTEFNLGKIPLPEFYNIENFYDLLINNRNKCLNTNCYIQEFPLNNGYCKFHCCQNALRIDDLYYILRYVYIITKDYEQKYKINLFNILNVLLLKNIINKKQESIKKIIERIKNIKNFLKKHKSDPTIDDVYEYYLKL